MRNSNSVMVLNSIFVIVLSGCASLSDDSGTKNEYATVEGLISKKSAIRQVVNTASLPSRPEIVQNTAQIGTDDGNGDHVVIRASSN